MKNESSTNEELQVSHHVLGWIEESKRQLETYLDSFSEVFAIIDDDGVVLDGNRGCAVLLGTDPELLVGCSLRSVFSEDHWQRFVAGLRRSDSADTLDRGVNFELTTDARTGSRTTHFLWSAFRVLSPNALLSGRRLFAITGKNISAVVDSESKLASILRSLPLCLLQVGPGLQITDLSVVHSKHVFHGLSLSGKGLDDLLFPSTSSQFTVEELNAVATLRESFNGPARRFDEIRSQLPHEILWTPPASVEQEARLLKLHYSAIVATGRLDGVLVVIEDRRPSEAGISGSLATELRLTAAARRYGDVERLPMSELLVASETLRSLGRQLSQEMAANVECLKLVRTLRSLESTALDSGFSDLAALCSAATALALTVDHRCGHETVAAILREMDDLRKVVYARLIIAGNQVSEPLVLPHSGRLVNPEQIISGLVVRVGERFARRLGKDVHFEVDLCGLTVSRESLMRLRVALCELVANAVEHGIEATGNERQTVGKSPQGLVKVACIDSASGDLHIAVTDDGAGFPIERIREAIVARGLRSRTAAMHATREEVLDLVFATGISGKAEYDGLSGAGIGLDLVRSSVDACGGAVKVAESGPHGTRIVLSCKRGQSS